MQFSLRETHDKHETDQFIFGQNCVLMNGVSGSDQAEAGKGLYDQ